MIKNEEKNLNRLQNISKIIAILSFGAFIVLIIFGAYELIQINKKINDADAELTAKNEQIGNKQAQIDELDKVLTNKETQIKAQTNTIKEVFKDSSKATINKVLENNPDAAQALPRIYVHIADESQRKQAEKIAESLQVGGYIVPKIENVGSIAPKIIELRYCKDKGQQSDLDNIKGLLARDKVRVEIRPPMTMASCNNVSSVRSYELWLEYDAKKFQKPDLKEQKKAEVKPIDSKKPVIKPQ